MAGKRRKMMKKSSVGLRSKHSASNTSQGSTSNGIASVWPSHNIPWFFQVKLKSPEFTSRLHLLETVAEMLGRGNTDIMLKFGYREYDSEVVVQFEYKTLASSGRVLCRFEDGWGFIAEELKLNQGDTVLFARDPTKWTLHVSVKRYDYVTDIITMKDGYDSDF